MKEINDYEALLLGVKDHGFGSMLMLIAKGYGLDIIIIINKARFYVCLCTYYNIDVNVDSRWL